MSGDSLGAAVSGSVSLIAAYLSSCALGAARAAVHDGDVTSARLWLALSAVLFCAALALLVNFGLVVSRG